jgi:hypothetical protein
MPLGETLTLLATLASAFQALRTGRADGSTATSEPAAAIDPAVLIALDEARHADDEVTRRQEAAASRLLWLAGLSAMAVLLSAFLSAASAGSTDATSLLFVLVLVIFVAISAGVIVLRRVFVPAVAFAEGAADLGSLSTMEALIEQRRRLLGRNRRSLLVLEIGADTALVLIAVQVILAGLWLID